MAYCRADGAGALLLEDGAWLRCARRCRRWRAWSPRVHPPADDPWAVGPVSGQGPEPRRGPARPDDLATLVYTSGTTGRPGVMLSHRNIVIDLIALGRGAEILDRRSAFSRSCPVAHVRAQRSYYIDRHRRGGAGGSCARHPELPEDLLSQRPTLMVTCHAPSGYSRSISSGQLARAPAVRPGRDIGWKRFGAGEFGERLLWPLICCRAQLRALRRARSAIRPAARPCRSSSDLHRPAALHPATPDRDRAGFERASVERPRSISVGRPLKGVRCASPPTASCWCAGRS